ncbi:threonine dehydratase [Rhodobacter capsulatus]|uniref:Threonine dehydratase n=1 Tax=Rhodobacter capsulatus TaxID=1061 RepID=A0A4U1JPP7_RHOCA|nr:threonine dehydratase [Rhodobacter capsulatus]TKD17839.1 threonine dehydratase [Rhodobacter capsulatus]
MQFTKEEIADAVAILRPRVPPTPAYAWPLLAARLGLEVIVKHENHTPTGAFKARGGLVYMERLRRAGLPPGVVTATRGNHGQSIAIGARAAGIPALIVVPKGNSPEKNAAMRAFGGEVLIAGEDFDAARGRAAAEAAARGYRMVPSFHRDLVQGVATYALELFADWQGIDVVFAPVGMGSGLCGLIAMRDLLGLKTEIVGVVAERAPAFARAFRAGHPVPGLAAQTFADGIACREPPPEALEVILRGAADLVEVAEAEIAEAMRVLFTDTHNLAEGAGAAALAGLMKCRARYAGKRAAVILSGGNIDRETLLAVLAGQTPGDARAAKP